ncbi:MAG: ORF6N domain-containing protein [Candidatus Gastranaerophilales bacterium]|nr:ORF6N domain-containing protein [Candidatus Gastranaerophilales bacterium]
MPNDLTNISLIEIKNLIYVIRGQKVMLDSDLAMLYGVLTKNLNKAVKRNIQRFPNDFMFQLTKNEYDNLKFQIGTSNAKWGGRRTLPFVFTEQGISMLSSVLQSEQAIAINIQIMRTFVKMKQFAIENKELAQRLTELGHYFIQYAKDNNAEIDRINEAINLLLDRTKPASIGFRTE